MDKRILIIANDESTILNFRQEVITAFIEQGFNVIVGYPFSKNMQIIESLGCKVVNLKVSRHGKNILQDMKLINDCRLLIKKYKPDIVLTYTVKPNIYGSFACQITNTPYINNVTGLGSVLQSHNFLSKLILALQKYAYRKSNCVFFQNQDNYQCLKKLKVISKKTPIYILPGSGVNLLTQTYEEYPKEDGITRFVIVSRIRCDKGYREFFDMTEAIKKEFPNTEFHIVGWYEEDALRSRLDELKEKKIIIYHGQQPQDEVHRIISKCNCLIHPSYHEGMANVLLEAAATGRPVIATDIPGCRETFDEGVTGFGCRAKDTKSLIETVRKFLKISYTQRMEMGKEGRNKMESQFDRNLVIEAYIKQIKQILD